MIRLPSVIALAVFLVTGPARAQRPAPADKSADIDFKAELPRIPPTEPADALATFRLQPGFKIELVAAEPLIRDPVAIDFDENGRLFVVEFPEYNQKHVRRKIADHGRVRVLDDVDGDGLFDRSEIYVDNLSYPSGVACYDGGVFVAAAPEILYCKDTDGDDHADIRQVVYSGFGQEFQRAGQAQLNSFRWGLDNRFHVCTNFSGGVIVRPDDATSRPVGVRNRSFLFDPRSRQYEAASGGGQHGLGIDDWGREFRCRNSDPFRLLVYDERYLARNPYLAAPAAAVNILESGKYTKLFRISRDEPWRALRTRLRTEGIYAGSNEGGKPFGFFTAATGVNIYRGDAWPAEYRGTGFIGEAANNLVFRAKFEPRGVGLVARRADSGAEFLACTDNWFRPVQFANGPDGALYVVDMYRELIEGATFLPPEILKHINVIGGVDRGRIYRIVSVDSKRRPRPQLARATTAQLVALLDHRNGWHRDTASRLLYTRQDRSAIQPLKNLVADSALPQGRMHALYALSGLHALDEPTLTRALADPHAHVRRHALRLAEPFAPRSPAIRKQLLSSADDDHVLVRFQAAFSLGVLPGAEKNHALARLARRDGNVLWFRLAILSAVADEPQGLFQTLLSDHKLRASKQGQTLLRELASQIGQSGKADAVRSLVASMELLPTTDASLARRLIQRTAVDGNSPTVTAALLQAGGKSGTILTDLLHTARKRAADPKTDERTRISAIRLLGLLKFADVEPIPARLLDVRQPKAVQLASVRLLARSTDPKVASMLLERWAGFSPQLRAEAVETLSSREAWLGALLGALETGDIGRGEIDSARLQLLAAHPSRSIRERAKRLASRGNVNQTQRKDVVAKYQPALTRTGNPTRGKEHFRKACSACHRLERVGTAVGADLKAIRNQGMPAILLNILDPNREVNPQYLTYVVLTSDGRAHTGMIQSESANSLSLRRPDNTTLDILRIDIEQMRSTGLSLMPEGLETQLDVQAMADLLAYLNAIE